MNKIQTNTCGECGDATLGLGENDIPVTIVFTKVDKKRKIKAGKRARPEENVENFCREVSEYWEEMPPMIFTSSKTGDG